MRPASRAHRRRAERGSGTPLPAARSARHTCRRARCSYRHALFPGMQNHSARQVTRTASATRTRIQAVQDLCLRSDNTRRRTFTQKHPCKCAIVDTARHNLDHVQAHGLLAMLHAAPPARGRRPATRRAHRCSATSSCTVPQAVAALPRKAGRSASFSSHSAPRPSGQNLRGARCAQGTDAVAVDFLRCMPALWCRDCALYTFFFR